MLEMSELPPAIIPATMPMADIAAFDTNMVDGESIANFLSTFGDSQKVKADIIAYWKAGGEPFPIPIYHHLMDQAITRGTISPAHGKLLEKYFLESFTPDSVTNYYPRHRSQLIRELVNAYVKVCPENPIYRVNADIMNLNGLNKVLKRLEGHHKLADSVIRFMTGATREELDSLGETCCDREGGDEIVANLWVPPGKRINNKPVTLDDVKERLRTAQHRIFRFVQDAQIEQVLHTKKDPRTHHLKPPGIGIGYGVIQILPDKNEIAQREPLEEAIDESKDEMYDLLAENPPAKHRSRNIVESITNAFSDSKYSRYLNATPHPEPMLAGDKNFTGDNPEDARYQRFHRALGLEEISPAQLALLKGTHAITRKFDTAAKLAMFSDMPHEILHNFLTKHGNGGTKVTLVHFDFDNMSGGNSLGSWVGDAMAKVFGECICSAMQKTGVGLEEYQPYLTSQNGGKFALLLPADTSQEKLHQLDQEVQKELHRRSSEKLNINGQELRATLRLMYKHKQPNEKRQQPLFENGYITIGQIVNLKTHLKGSVNISKAIKVDTTQQTLPDAMSLLEKDVSQYHAIVDEFRNYQEAAKRNRIHKKPEKPDNLGELSPSEWQEVKDKHTKLQHHHKRQRIQGRGRLEAGLGDSENLQPKAPKYAQSDKEPRTHRVSKSVTEKILEQRNKDDSNNRER